MFETSGNEFHDPFFDDFHAIPDGDTCDISDVPLKLDDVNTTVQLPKKTISSSDATQANIEEMIKMVPSVLEKLSKYGNDKTLLDFFSLVANDKFPLENIAFTLWMEVVKWYSCTNTSMMRYSNITKKFWKLGYRTFGGQFVRFMSGYKNNDCLVIGDANKGVYSPNESTINFAVPDMRVIRHFSPYDVPVDMCNSRTPEAIRYLRKKKLLQPITTITDSLSDLDETADVNSVSHDLKENLNTVLTDALKDVSMHILDMQEIRKKKEYAKEKLIKRSGETDWRNGKYVLAISSIIAFIHDIDKFHGKSISLIDEITKCISCLNNTQLSETVINLDETKSYKKIKDTDESIHVTSSREIKQRSPEWFEKRKQAKVTDSTFFRALGLDGLQKQKENFDTVVCGVPEKSHSEKTKEALHYGTVNEINAMATFVGKVIPLLFPKHECFEEGYIEIGDCNSKPVMIVSPDGSVICSQIEESTLAGIELKCPIQQVHKQLPTRYLLQCLSEIEALNVNSLIYLSWTPELSTVFRIKRNKAIFMKAYTLAEKLYNVQRPRRPCKLTEEAKLLKQEIEKECSDERTVEFIGLIRSIRHDENAVNVVTNEIFRLCRVQYMLNNLHESHQMLNNLKREPASDAVVFLCCDLDREWKRDSIRCAPLSWFPKGYSRDTTTLRSLLETILDACKKSCTACSGAWYNIAVRSVDDEPLTLLQLQKTVWKKVEGMSKADIMKELKSLNKQLSQSVTKQRLREQKKETENEKKLVNMSSIVNNDKGIEENVDDEMVEMENNDKHIAERTESLYTNGDDEADDTNTTEMAIHSKTKSLKDFSTQDDVKVTDLPMNTSKNNVVPEPKPLSSRDASAILAMLQTDKMCNNKGQWNCKTSNDVLQMVKSVKDLSSCRDVDLRIIVRYTKRVFNAAVKESGSKQAKIDRLCEVFGLQSNVEGTRTIKKRKPLDVKKFKTRQQYEVSCIDSSHLLTRTRRKCCKGGLDGLSNKAWREVAKTNKTQLSLAMIDCSLAPLSVSVALTHFSEPVELMMKEKGYLQEALLCKDIRMWWKAEDDAGIPAHERIKLRMALRQRLLGHVDFGHFPPPTVCIKGWPLQLWEALIANIDAKI
ncbi:hypothetical protein MAR_012634, partial [Mya arenaria]